MKTGTKTLLKRLLTATAVTAATAALTTAPATGPASATDSKPATPAASNHGCNPGYFCLYELTSYQGSRYGWSGNDGDYSDNAYPTNNVGTPSFVNNNSESAINNGVAARHDGVRLFDGVGFNKNSDWTCMSRGWMYADLSVVNMKNKASSHKWVTC